MLTRSEKEEIVKGLKADIDKAKAVFLTNLVGITSNQAVEIRKNVRQMNGKIIITRNTLFARAAAKTACEKLLANLKGTQAVAFAFDDPAAVAKCLKDAGEELEIVELRGGVLGEQELSKEQVKELASLPSRDEMLGTLLATFMAPISALARVLNSIKEQKDEGTEKQEQKQEQE